MNETEDMLAAAVQLHQAGRLQEAGSLYQQVIDAHATNVVAWGNLGIVWQQLGNLAQAAECFRRICAFQPENAEAFNHLGVALGMAGQLAKAAEALRTATRLDPNLADAFSNLANTLISAGQPSDAIPAAQRAIELEPAFPPAHYNLAIALRASRRLAEAIVAMQRAIQLAPEEPQFAAVLVAWLRNAGRLTDAMRLCRDAIERFPNDPRFHNLAGIIHAGQGDADLAVAEYRAAIKVDPNAVEAHDNLLLTLHYFDSDPRELFNEHVAWARAFPPTTNRHASEANPERRLRIGYVSPDLRRHSVAYLLEAPLRCHDRTHVEVFVYSDAADADDMTARLGALADAWRNSATLSHKELFDRIVEDRIDILIDCAGHTSHNRLPTFARKPAPVQVTLLGYPNTTGLDAMDYRITDAIADPPGLADELHVERLRRIAAPAWCFSPPENAPAAEVERNADGITFGCFNILAKITPRWIDVWRRILSRVSGSRLVLKNHSLADEETRRIVADRFSAHGISSAQSQLVAPQNDPAEHLNVYNRIDIALDTFPYHGTATTCDALWMGTPVVTMAGQTHVSRVGASLLSAAGLEDLIAKTPQEYEEIAVGLANDRDRVIELRKTLRQRMSASPLMDAEGYTRKLESAYRDMWRTRCEQRSAGA